MIDSQFPKEMIKVKNTSNKTLLIYLKDTYSNTIINTKDKNMLHIGLYATNVLIPDVPTIEKNSVRYASDKSYCNQWTWSNYVKNDTLILFIFDKKKLLETSDIEVSKMKMLYITYSYLHSKNDTIVYSE
jgi:hypothetical protein